LRDDAARLELPAGAELVATADALVGGVHFFVDDPADAIARKALRVNLSDLAAKGARPLGFLLSLALPPGWTADWLQAFARGLGEDAAHYGCPLLGGDTVQTPGPLTLSITALGAAGPRGMVRRTGARPGDALYVTGTIGDAALGLQARLGRLETLSDGARAHLLRRYLLPEPRLALGPAMAEFANGGMDVSDGMIGDLTKMLRVSGVTAEVDLDRLPLSDAAREAIAADDHAFEIAVTGGDDYELLATVGAGDSARFEAAARAAGVALACIGRVREGEGAPRFLRNGESVAFARGSFSHF
jgi:thiamine-monophosphate kinase